ncbi:uncharacterized protein HMPREF1541_00368 [Cyphellophora europaea CBS 101466]|uniref:Elongation factor 2 n=1 Tax=Cyphellophora europaea (strain CBS 101466) TaxID=1220924 RepID=W2SE41_CYPE1|nr:uncharacterized protein HMPREF1541_00368 [Cyphellophora europaea CBS 101466]ETN46184.1 hypothetical protein HMPREF1541_00368 [Cyphellophora europaea CBS 101466]
MAWNLFPRGGGTFNWTWVIELIVCICLVNWFLFYFNRVLATLISYGLRAYTWNKFKVWVDIQSLQISLLGGRIFFKGVRYHGENETIFIQQGFITWRYYFRSTRQVNLFKPLRTKDSKDDETKSGDSASDNGQESDEDNTVQPGARSDARIAINATGLEWFVYNRTPAYDAIIAAADKGSRVPEGDPSWNGPDDSKGSDGPSSRSTAKRVAEKLHVPISSSSRSSPKQETPSVDGPSLTPMESRNDADAEDDQSIGSDTPIGEAHVNAFHSLILAVLPVGVEVSRGAISLGNESTRAIVVTTFTKAKGHIDGGAAVDKDIFRQIFDFEIEHPLIQMKPNPEFRHSQMAAAERIIQGIDNPNRKRRWWQIHLDFRKRRHEAAQHLRRLVPPFHGSVESFRPASYSGRSHNSYKAFGADSDEGNVWHGLDRYLDENDRDDHEAWSHIDYARFSTIVDCPAIHFNFYWDVQGTVPPGDAVQAEKVASYDLNGDVPPAYGMHLTVRGGDVNYGPWADRLRLEIQSTFFPNAYRNATPAEAPATGDLRIYTTMNIRVDIAEDVSLRVPMREQSKDWHWRGRAHAVREAAMLRRQRERRTHFRFRRTAKKATAPDVRPFGWFSFTVGKDTTVKYDMAMIPDGNGYKNTLQMNVVDARATSSVNHALLWRCPSHKITCDLPYPLGWNDMHKWTFNIESDQLEMFILRDHMFLLIDLIGDFTAGQKADFMTFVPYNYNIGLVFTDLKLYLNANDFNIIDSPTDINENAYLVLGFKLLNGFVGIPMKYYAPRQSQVLFKANGNNAYLNISSPIWNTLHTFLVDDEYVPDLKTMGTLKGLEMDGSYNYYTSMSPGLSDSLLMNITGLGPRFHLHGFLIRYFMNVKENYFGDHLHFRTLEEYQALIEKDRPETAMQRPTSKENDLDVILTVRADQTSILIPSNIYTRRKGIRADILMVEADMRFTNYYMDLQVNSSPIEASIETVNGPGQKPDITSTQVFLENVVVYGHRLFGAPPTEPTYSCHWDVDVGFISGQCSSEFLGTLIQGVQSLIFTIDDFENALPNVLSKPIFDVNFVRARVAGIKLWILSESTAFLAEITPLTVDFDDWAGRDFAKHINVDIPAILIAAAELKSALRHHEIPDHEVETFGLFRTSLRLATLDKTANLARTRALQQAHLRYSDQRTHRVDWLLHKPTVPGVSRTEYRSEWSRNPPSMPTPTIPEPILDITDLAERQPMLDKLGRKSSFISSKSSLNGLGKKSSSHKQILDTPGSKYNTRGDARSVKKQSSFLDKSIARNSLFQTASKEPGAAKQGIGATSVTLSSPWTAPHFTLQDAVPSSADMPDTLLLSPTVVQRTAKQFPAAEDDPSEDEGEGHMGLILSLEQGLVGFCTPALLSGIAGLVDELKPKTSLDRLDGAQRDVIELVMQKLRPMKGSKTFDLDIRLPYAHIRFIHAGEIQDIPPVIYKDQYDIRLKRGRANVRFITKQIIEDANRPITHGLLIHTTLDNLSIDVSNKNTTEGNGPAYAGLVVSRLGIWFSSMEQLRGMVQVAEIATQVAASKLEQMAQLIHRTTTMIEGLVETFSTLDDSLKTRHLVYHLTQAATAASDPVFLTRPSYVLRSTDDHVRSSESWKILVRLRQIFTSSIREAAAQTFDDCPCSGVELQDGAREQMMQAFEDWRAWDSVPAHKVPVMAALFGQDVKIDGSTAALRYMCLEIVMGNMSVILDPGPSQSDVTLNGLEAGISFDPGFRGLYQAGDTKVVVQAYTAEFAVNLNWELVELSSSLMKMIRSSEPHNQLEQVELSKKTSLDRFAIEAVVCTDLVSLSAKTPTITLRLGAESLNTTTFLNAPAGGALAAFFTVTSTAAMARVAGLDKELLRWKLTQPKVSGSFAPPPLEDDLGRRASTLRLGAACDKLRFKLKEDINFVMRVASAVVDKEVSQVHKLFLSSPIKAKRPRLDRTEPMTANRLQLHLAFFLEDYKLDLVLLPALRYAINGRVARTSVIPRGNGQMTINFDLKSHEHVFRGVWDTAYEKPSTLQMPPINGQLCISVGDKTTMLGVHTTIEQIEFEAAAVRACFDVVNQPGFIDSAKSIQADATSLQERLDKLLMSSASARVRGNAPKPPTVLRYGFDGTLAGIRIHCQAPSLLDSDATADLNFEVGRSAIKIHNMMKDSTKVYEKPQFSVSIREISVGLFRKNKYSRQNYGTFSTGVQVLGITEIDDKDNHLQVYNVSSHGIRVDMYEETASLVVDIATFLQERIKSITISEQAKNLKPIRRLTLAHLAERNASADDGADDFAADDTSTHLFDSVVALSIDRIQIRWGLHETTVATPGRTLEDLIFSIRKVDLQTRQEGSARLSMAEIQLQLVPHFHDPTKRSANSALLPEVIFSTAYVSTKKERRLAFQAKGKALELRLGADFVLPASLIQKSLAGASKQLRESSIQLSTTNATPEAKRKSGALLGRKRFAWLAVDADFAGAVVHVSPRQENHPRSAFGMLKGSSRSRAGRYLQATHGDHHATEAILQAPGIAIKVQYHDNGTDDPTLSTELKVAASSNTLYPSVVPLILDISSSIKELMGDENTVPKPKNPPPTAQQTTNKYLSDGTLEPNAILGRAKLNAGLWIQRQEFSLSCQPIARVAATAKFEEIFLTVNTVQGPDQNRFFSILTTFNKLQTSVQHVYSRESTASFELDSFVVSLMNSKHVSQTTGISAIVNVSPMKMDINAKQLQDFLLFREIWYPAELRATKNTTTPVSATADTQAFAIQRYQQITASGTLPWNAIVSLQELNMQVDFGPGLGKSVFTISKLWASSKKNSDAEQNLCIGFDKIAIDSSGRMSGFVELANFRVRTSIRWPENIATSTRAPLVQASVGFHHLRAKAVFDYQPFAVVDISTFEALMYNVRQDVGQNDRLVAMLNGGKVQGFCTTLAGAQGLALMQAFERLIEDKKESFQASLQELDKHLRRKSVYPTATWTTPVPEIKEKEEAPTRDNFSLHTDVVVAIGEIDIGVFPNTFFDNQILKLEATDAQARFAVAVIQGRVQSGLGMRLGQVRVALSSINKPNTKALGEVSVPEVIERATGSRGGTILKVPRLVSSMQTWQTANSNTIEYIFRSVFEGKVDVGWNYSRISFIRDMWGTHSRAFAARAGKPLPEPAVKITAEQGDGPEGSGKEKITAVVNMPTSKFKYVALEPPVIDTPQLRDMGEATPPLEWIGLHRDRLPEATHSVAIVTLLEIAKEVEDAYVRILGSS